MVYYRTACYRLELMARVQGQPSVKLAQPSQDEAKDRGVR